MLPEGGGRIVIESSCQIGEFPGFGRWQIQITRVATDDSKRVDEPAQESVSGGKLVGQLRRHVTPLQEPVNGLQSVRDPDPRVLMAGFNLAGLYEVFNVYEPARPELGVYLAGRSQFPRLPATEMSDVFRNREAFPNRRIRPLLPEYGSPEMRRL